MFDRNQSDDLQKLLNSNSRNVILVEGARQVGKTTLIEELLRKTSADSIKINLETNLAAVHSIDQTESFSDLELYLKTEYGFEDKPGSILFIDEAQESERLGRYVRSFKEKWSHTKVILTGSSMGRLFRDDQRIPVGRYTSKLITPLTFREFLKACKKNALLELLESFSEKPSEKIISESAHRLFIDEVTKYFSVGGLPAVVSDFINNENWKYTRSNILLSQTEDFIRKSQINDKFLFLSAMKGIANNLGNPSKYTHISEKYNEAKKLTAILKSWKLIFEIEQKGNSTSSVFYPKRYIYDIGIAQDLRVHPFPEISLLHTLSSALRTPLGGLIENALCLQLISDMNVQEISGWKSSSDQNKEIDFVVKSNKLWPIECKSTLKLSTKHFYGLREYLKISAQNVGFLISLAPYKVLEESENRFVNLPFYLAQDRIFNQLI